jgi:hypothetical protein
MRLLETNIIQGVLFMSTYFKPAVKLSLQEIEDKIKDIEVVIERDRQLFIMGNDCLHFDIDKKNNVTDIYRYGPNDETNILAKLSKHFDVAIFSEYEEEYEQMLEMEEESNVLRISNDDLQPAKTLN